MTLLHQGKDYKEQCVFERGADRRAVEEQVGERKGKKQDAEELSHLVGE